MRILISITLLFAIIGGLACRKTHSANEKRFDLKGKVIAVDKNARTATIAHEDIPGYMGAMTMPFAVKSDGDLEMIKPGNAITATVP